MWVQSLGWKDPLEKGMVTPSSILAWKIPWTEEPGGLQPVRSQRVRHDCEQAYTLSSACQDQTRGYRLEALPDGIKRGRA